MRATQRPGMIRAALAATSLLGATLIGAPSAIAEGPCGVLGSGAGLSRIGNMVFADSDNDGLFEPGAGDNGISGVGVELWSDVDSDGTFEPATDDASGQVCATTTDAGGNYWFHDIAPGNYFVAVGNGVPAGYISSTGANTSATMDNTDDGEPAGNFVAVSSMITLDGATPQPTGETPPAGTSGDDETAANAATVASPDEDSNLTIDFGFTPDPAAPSASCLGLGNRIWLDLNNDGITQADETGIDGVTVELYAADNAGAPTGTVLETAVTLEGGYYLFSCVNAGDYTVVVPASNFADGQALSGLRSSTDGPSGDQADDGNDPATVGDPVVTSVITVAPGNAPTAEPDKPAGGTYDFDAPSDSDVNTEIDFGFTGLTLGNRVWLDAVHLNGIQDVGEPGIGNVAVELWNATDSGPTGNAPIATTTTDDQGYYLFKGLTSGTYIVRVPDSAFAADAPLSGLTSTPGNGPAPDPDEVHDDQDDNGDGPEAGPTDSLPVTLEFASEPTGETDVASGMDSYPSDANANVTVDFGFVSVEAVSPSTASVGDRVWVDADRDGVQDPGEHVVPGVTVTILDANGETIGTTTTGLNGEYLFTGVPPSTYTICFDLDTIGPGMVPTEKNSGEDNFDSDADGVTGCTEPINVEAGDEDLSIDLGVYPAVVDLSISKSGRYENGKTIWSIIVENSGPDRDPGDVLIIDNLPNDVDFESASGAGATCVQSADGSTVTCTLPDGLGANDSATIQVVTTMKSSGDCSTTNSARVKGTGSDENGQNNAVSETITNACAGGTAQGRLPVTGTSALVFALLALGMGLGGWKLLGVSGHLRAARLRNRLEP